MPKMRALMGVCGGSSYADHPTKTLMGYFARSLDVGRAVCDEAEDVVGSLICVCPRSLFGIGGGGFQKLMNDFFYRICQCHGFQMTPLSMKI